MMKIEEIRNKNYKIQNPDFESSLRLALEKQFFMKLIGFEITKIEAGYVEGELLIHQNHMQQHGFLHGGLMATCLDIVMGFSAFTLLPKEKGVVTADMSVNYYNPGLGYKLVAKGWVDKPGSRLHFCEGEICVIDEAGNEVLTNKAKSIMCIIDLPKT